MCGIFGFNFDDTELLKRMGKVLEYRGPNDSGFYIDGNISLGHRRLSVIDISAAGRQPMSNEDGTIWMTYNGEIYNFKELKKDLSEKHNFHSKTDTEVILHAYEEYGVNFVEKLRGMFAFALYDTEKKRLILARDRMGIKPLYYFFDGNILLFASEIKAILESGIKREVDYRALSDFLTFLFVPAPKTMFKGIKKLLPGHLLIYENNQIYPKRYWSLNFNQLNKSENFFIFEMRRILEESVKMRLISDVPLGVYLSGGIDSSIIVGLMSKFMDEVKTFSIGFGYEKYDETPYARTVAEYFSTDHKEFIVDADTIKLLPEIVYHFDEPLADPAAIPTYLLSQEAKKYVTVVLTGEGGDELFGGYEQYKIVILGDRINFIPRSFRNCCKVFSIIPNSVLDKFFKYASSLGKEGMNRFYEFVKSKDPMEKYMLIVSIFTDKEKSDIGVSGDSTSELIKPYFDTNLDLLNKMILAEINTSLPDNLLMKVDKMTMAHSIEARVPYLDHIMAEFSAKIPANLKLKGFTEKYILRRTFHDLLPKEIVKRKKQRFFVPIDEWFGGEIEEMIWEYVEKGVKRRHFQRNYIEKVKRNYINSPLYYSRQLWNLLNFEIWYDVFEVE